MDSENIAAYVGLDVHKETLAIATPEWLGEIRYYGTINNEAWLYIDYVRNCRDLTETFFPAMKVVPVGLGYIINSQ